MNFFLSCILKVLGRGRVGSGGVAALHGQGTRSDLVQQWQRATNRAPAAALRQLYSFLFIGDVFE